MIELKYTSGPWEYDSEVDDDEPIRIYGPDQCPIAIVPDEFGSLPSRIEVDAANARLIAPAPAMLAVLLRALDEPRLPINLVGEVKTAIGLALGWSWWRVADDASEGH